ncbi:MAG: hypothetical protein EA344_11600 [Alkalicoccus sp.]|nr:MAG: hypothetical protein EA344_11600 [Alkalicoccus sp.]
MLRLFPELFFVFPTRKQQQLLIITDFCVRRNRSGTIFVPALPRKQLSAAADRSDSVTNEKKPKRKPNYFSAKNGFNRSKKHPTGPAAFSLKLQKFSFQAGAPLFFYIRSFPPNTIMSGTLLTYLDLDCIVTTMRALYY